MIDLSNAELFLDLTTIDYDGSFFDLHNEYECTEINYNLFEKSINFLFQPRASAQIKKDLYLLFEDATIANCTINLKRTADSGTLDLFYRGRYEIADKIFETSSDGENIFYVNFIEGDSFIIFSKKVTLKH
jgi:hypothetical protein